MKNKHIAETAIIECEYSDIGDNTKIWNWVHVMKGVKIGKNCMLGNNVFVGENVTIGDNCKIQNGVQLFDGVTIGNHVFIGPNVVFTNCRFPNPRMKCETYSKIMIEDDVMIGANSTIVAPCHVYNNAFIGAGSVVTKDVLGVTVCGNPAKIIRRY